MTENSLSFARGSVVCLAWPVSHFQVHLYGHHIRAHGSTVLINPERETYYQVTCTWYM